MHVLGELTVEEFLRDYWHKKPVLIRNAWPDFEPLLSSQELAGLSLEQEIESRIVEENGQDGPWSIRKGPFTEDDYLALPESHWTLLVQGVDQWIPEAADLLEHFRFIPGWRIDDLMISYATDSGSVGPHYDQYDVFLLQAEGQREWRTGQMCGEHTPFMKGPKIRILENFEESDRWLLNPGDMLYLPPALAHWGIARGECQTYSIGFRAPALTELAPLVFDDLMENASDDQRYADPDLSLQDSTGRIDQAAAQRLRKLLTEAIQDDERLQSVIGRLMTEPKYAEHVPDAETLNEDTEALLRQAPAWKRAEFSRFAYSEHNGHCRFYAMGQEWKLPLSDLPLARLLADERQYGTEALISTIHSETAEKMLKLIMEQHLIYNPEAEYGD
ncbi:MAG: cupin [Oceanospirillaceae bacterium]|nr:cupin [Oceanospirillaceae bacterium]MBT11505.1 cupin [Oceanospirillaceae bacterium]|tara:strand:+ start:37627 stop:38790 length:1164 start_codon:yes stop_codon:yes gene_type:complete